MYKNNVWGEKMLIKKKIIAFCVLFFSAYGLFMFGKAQAAEKPSDSQNSAIKKDNGSVAKAELPTPYHWNISKDVNINFAGYVQANAYGVHKSKASFGTGTVDRPFDTYFNRVYLAAYGGIFNYKYFMVYNFASRGSHPSNGLIWAWLSHSLGPGTLFVGQHWNYSSMEEPVSSAKLMFIGRNFNSSSGITSLFNHDQGLFYQISTPYGNKKNNIFWGVSAYSLNNTISHRNPAPGYGVNTALEWAPVVTDRLWYQFGATYVHARTFGDTALASVTPFYAGARQPAQIIAYYPNSQALADPTKNQVQVNFAGSFGSLFLLGEYGMAIYSQKNNHTDHVQAYSVQAGYWLTGEVTPFDPKIASYGLPVPIHKYGAIDVVAGYDRISNLDINNKNVGAGRCIPTATTPSFDPSKITKCNVESYRLAANYYINPMMRFTVQVTKSIADLGNAGKDDPWEYEAQAQWEF